MQGMLESITTTYSQAGAYREVLASQGREVSPAVGVFPAPLCVVADAAVDGADGIHLPGTARFVRQRDLAHPHQPQRLIHVRLCAMQSTNRSAQTN